MEVGRGSESTMVAQMRDRDKGNRKEELRLVAFIFSYGSMEDLGKPFLATGQNRTQIFM